MSGSPPRALRVGARTVQIGLGTIWLFDGLLQLQPKMFGPAFADQVIRPAAGGQPGVVAWPVEEMARLVSVHPAASNVVFAAVQLLIGIGLLRRETVRPALAVSFAWSAGVWCFGEGLGMLFTGTASPLSGAPGAVLLYALVGVAVWPRRRPAGGPDRHVSAAAAGLLGDRGARALWAALWTGMAALWLLPANHAPDAVSSALAGAAGSSPVWLAHLQSWLAGVLRGDGVGVSIVLGALSIAIGTGPLVVRRPTPFLVAGVALSLDFWLLGQSLGGIVTGIATDPNAGPLFVLFALALFPSGPDTAPAERARRGTVHPWPSTAVPSPALTSPSRTSAWGPGPGATAPPGAWGAMTPT